MGHTSHNSSILIVSTLAAIASNLYVLPKAFAVDANEDNALNPPISHPREHLQAAGTFRNQLEYPSQSNPPGTKTATELTEVSTSAGDLAIIPVAIAPLLDLKEGIDRVDPIVQNTQFRVAPVTLGTVKEFQAAPFLVSQADRSSSSDEVNTDSEAAAEQQKAALLGIVLSELNHSPYVFGTPTTVVGDFSSNTQLTGDWGGARWSLPENKVFFDIYGTTTPQGVVSGGISGDAENPTVSQNLDAYLNVVEPWPGAILHASFQSKIGSTLDGSGKAGALSLVNYGEAFPLIDPGDYGLMSEYYLLQSFSPQVQFLAGKVNFTNFADTNFFANNYRYQFQNASLNNNLMLGSYVPPSTWAAAILAEPTSWFTVLTAVGDPTASAENFADNFFKNFVVAQQYSFSYDIENRPGNFLFGWVYDNLEETNFEDPINILDNGIIDFRDPIRTTDGAFMFFLNFDQYLFYD